MGRIDANSWIGVNIYNTHKRGQQFNRKFSLWIGNHLSMVDHYCFNRQRFKIWNPRRFVNSYKLFGVDIGIQKIKIPNLFNKRCIFCIDLNQNDLNEEIFTHEEQLIVDFYNHLKRIKNNSTVFTTKTLFAWWPDLFIPLDRTHNYNNIVFEFQTYGVNLPIKRNNEIQKINGTEYIKMLRIIQLQLHKWMRQYRRHQTDLRRIDNSMVNSPFLRVIDKNYW